MSPTEIPVSIVKVEHADRLIVKVLQPSGAAEMERLISLATSRSDKSIPAAKDLIGKMVLAKMPTDVGYQYRRAIFKSECFSDRKYANCEFIDEGIESVAPISSVFLCPEEIEAFERHVRTLKLGDLSPLSWQPTIVDGQIRSSNIVCEHWTDAARYHVSDLLEKCLLGVPQCWAKVWSTDDQNVWHGDLIYSIDTKKQSLRYELINNQYALDIISSSPASVNFAASATNAKSAVSARGRDRRPGQFNALLSKKTSAAKPEESYSSFCVMGSSPYPQPFTSDNSSFTSYCGKVQQVYESFPFSSYHRFVWPGIDSARNVIVSMPTDFAKFDETGLSLLLPGLMDALEKSRSKQTVLNAIFVVPSGDFGSKLTKQLSNDKLKFKVKFLSSISEFGDSSQCDILILTPPKLRQFLRGDALNMESIKYLAFPFIDETCRSKDDAEIIMDFKRNFLRYRDAMASARLFATIKQWSNSVTAFYKTWFGQCTPLAYFLDLVEASVFCNTRHSFIEATKESLPRTFMDSLRRLEETSQRIAICCGDSDFTWIRDILRNGSVSVCAVDPELAGMRGAASEELGKWVASPDKQCLLIPDSLLLDPSFNLSVGATVIIHIGPGAKPTSFHSRFILFKPTWQDKNGSLNATESIVVAYEPMKKFTCKYINDLMQRSGTGRSPVLDKWILEWEHSNSNAITVSDVGNVKASPAVLIEENELCYRLLETGKCNDESSCRKRHALKPEVDCPIAADQSSKYKSLFPVRNGGLANFQILKVFSGSHFGAIMKFPVNSSDDLDRIERRLGFDSKNHKKVAFAPTVGSLYGCQLDNGLILRRVVVLKNLGIDEALFHANAAVLKEGASAACKYLVRLVDYGCDEISVSGDCLFGLSDETIAEPWLTVDVFLSHVLPADRAWPVSVIENLKTKLIGKELEASIALILRHQVIVTSLVHREALTAQGTRATVTNLRNELFNQGFAVNNDEHLRHLVDKCLEAQINVPSTTRGAFKPPAESLEPRPILLTSKLDPIQEMSLETAVLGTNLTDLPKIRISAVTNPSTFFVQKIECLDNLFRLEKEIEEWMKTEGDQCTELSSDILAPKQLCLARMPVNDQWTRVAIRSINKQKQTVEVFAVDHGEVEVVSIRNIRTVSRRIASYPAFAIECRLAHVKPLQGEDVFSEEAGNMLWDMGFSNALSRPFFARVVEKSKRGYFCRSGCHVVELWPAFEDEKNTPPTEKYQLLSVATQLIRLAVVQPDYCFLEKSFSSLDLSQSPSELRELFVDLIPVFLSAEKNVKLYQAKCDAWLAKNAHLLQDFLSTGEEFNLWAHTVDHTISLIDFGDCAITALGLDILSDMLQSAVKFFEANCDGTNERMPIVFSAARRLLPIAVYLVGLTLEESCLDTDFYAADLLCESLDLLIATGLINGPLAKKAGDLCIYCGIIPVLMEHCRMAPNGEIRFGCLKLLTSLMQTRAFISWLRNMSSYKSNAFVQSFCIEREPWTKFVEIIDRLIADQNPTHLTLLLKAMMHLLLNEGGYVSVVNESALGPCLGNMRERLLPLVKDKENKEDPWNIAINASRTLNTVLEAYWMTEHDPEVDSDFYDREKRKKRGYRLPPSANSDSNATPMQSAICTDELFGTILWSQRFNGISIQFDNAKITQSNLDIRLSSDGTVLHLMIRSSRRTMEIYLFAAVVDDSVIVRDTFAGARVKLKKRVVGDWPTLEAAGKKLANVKRNFQEEDDDDDDDDDDSDYGGDETGHPRPYIPAVAEALSDDEDVVDADANADLNPKARELLPEDFPCDDDGFD